MEAFTTIAIEGDRGVSEDIVDEVVHGRLGELASFSTDARETTWAFDFLIEEFVNVCGQRSTRPRIWRGLTDTTILATEESTGDACTVDLLAMIVRLVGI